ncbi:MAG: hypothetical protein FJ030_17305 [Chloroflexi bacterium]|nr:hypothetical protein [Chloroflexota bacterium]
MILAITLTACGRADDPTPHLVTLTPSLTQRATSPVTPSVSATDSPIDTATPSPTDLASPTDTAPPPPPSDTPPPPTPTVDPWPAALAAPGQSKIGIHVILNDDPRIMEFIRRVKPRVVKGLDNLDWLAEVKQASPQTITIGRFTENPFTSVLDSGNPAQYPNPADSARNFIDHYINNYRLYPGVDYWEGWNEPQWHTPAEWQWYAEFEASRACFMNDLGLKAAIGGFSAGTPEFSDMAFFVPGLQKAAPCNAIFTLHEYSSPTMQTGFNSGIPNAAHVDDAGSLTLRYRYWYEGHIKPRGFTIPLVISEAGIDSHVGPGCPLKEEGGQGWYACYKDWDAMNLGPEKWRVYLDQLIWYDNELRQDNYVIGFTIFTAGTSNVEAWRTFDINDMLVPMAHYMAGLP